MPKRAWWLSTSCAVLLACVVLLPLLGHKPLTDWDEGIYAEVSREMLTRGWLTPHWNGLPWFEKPPLMLWITAVFFKLFGVNEFWARAASAFAGIALTGLLHGWLYIKKDRLTAWLSTIFLLATPGILHICRTGEMDAMLTLWSVVALIGLAEIDGGNGTGWYVFWTGFAAALMTKGAASVVIPLTLIVLAALGGWRRWNFGKAFWLGLLIFLSLTLPWHLAMIQLYGRAFLGEYLGFHVLVRATQQIEGHVTPWWFFGIVLISYAWPLIGIFPFTLDAAWQDRPLRVWAVFTFVTVAFFSLIQTRLPHYVAPVYPALGILSACFVTTLLQAPWFARRRRVALATFAAVWIIPLAFTSGLRSSLHRAEPAGTTAGRDRRESIDMARLAARIPVHGPLLVLRGGAPASIAAEVFYARRPVQQVQIEPVPTAPAANRYAESRIALADALASEPELLLIDNDLLSRLPASVRFDSLRHGRTVTLGTITKL